MRTRKAAARSLALACVLTLFAIGIARADGFVAKTRLDIRPSPGVRVAAGTLMTFSGTLHSKQAFCRNDSVVTLRVYGESQGKPFVGGRVESMTTGPGGRYEFTVRVDEQARYRVWFRGKVGGVHPDIKTCAKSRSRTVTIHVG